MIFSSSDSFISQDVEWRAELEDKEEHDCGDFTGPHHDFELFCFSLKCSIIISRGNTWYQTPLLVLHTVGPVLTGGVYCSCRLRNKCIHRPNFLVQLPTCITVGQFRVSVGESSPHFAFCSTNIIFADCLHRIRNLHWLILSQRRDASVEDSRPRHVLCFMYSCKKTGWGLKC